MRTIGAANLGFTDNLALRLSAVHDERDSFTDNIGPSPSEPGNVGRTTRRANLAFRALTAAFTANLSLEHFDWETDNNAMKNRNDLVTSDPFTIEEDATSFMNQKGHRASARAALRADRRHGRCAAGSAGRTAQTDDQTDGDRTATAPPQPPTANVGRVAYRDARASTPGSTS